MARCSCATGYGRKQALFRGCSLPDCHLCGALRGYNGRPQVEELLCDGIGWYCHGHADFSNPFRGFGRTYAYPESDGLPQRNTWTSAPGKALSHSCRWVSGRKSVRPRYFDKIIRGSRDLRVRFVSPGRHQALVIVSRFRQRPNSKGKPDRPDRAVIMRMERPLTESEMSSLF
jgi:hypothetical protein